MDIKKRISLILCVMMLALAIFPVAIVSAAESQVSMTAKMGTTTLTDGGTYNVQGGEKVTVSAKSTVTNIERIGYYFESTDHAVKTDIKDIYKSSIEIPIPATNPIQGKGNTINLRVEAIADNDDNTPNTITKTGWMRYVLVYPATEKVITVKTGSTTVAAGATVTVEKNAKVTITATPKAEVESISYAWKGYDSQATTVSGNTATTTVPAGAGQTAELIVAVQYKDGPSGASSYFFKVKEDQTYTKVVTVKTGSTTVKVGNTVTVEKNAKVTITATPKDKVVSISYAWKGFDSKATTVTGNTATITVPAGAGQTAELIVAVQYEDGATPAESYFFKVKEEQAPETYTKVVTVKTGSTTVKAGETVTVEKGAKVTITATPKDKVVSISYGWKGIDTQAKTAEGNTVTLTIPAKAGETSELVAAAQYVDGATEAKSYFFKVPDEQTPITNKNVVVYVNGKKVEKGSITEVKVGDVITMNALPEANATQVHYILVDSNATLDKKDLNTVNGKTASATIVDGSIAKYIMGVSATYTDGDVLKFDTYYFKVVPADKPTTPNTLDVEPWMEENDDIEELSISLRNDSEETEKANKNIYELNETVTYYIDYKNGGKDIDSECSIKLELPLEFDVVDAMGGKVEDDTITWVFPNGLKEDEAGTLIVKVKYTSLKKSKDYANTIYPSASILKGTKVKDISTVINYIITSYDEKLKNEEHEPYMYGDANADTFRPDYLITRAEGAMVLARIYGLEDQYRSLTEDEITTKYTDIDETYFEAQQAITAASKAGLINGYLEDDGTYTYRPNNKMTKAEFIKILACMIQGNAEDEGIDGLEIKPLASLVKKYDDTKRFYMVDGKKVYNHWALEEITLMARLNMLPFLTEDDPSFTLDEGITRAEIAQLVNAYLLRASADVTSKTAMEFSDVTRKHKLVADIVEATREAHIVEINEEDGTEVVR